MTILQSFRCLQFSLKIVRLDITFAGFKSVHASQLRFLQWYLLLVRYPISFILLIIFNLLAVFVDYFALWGLFGEFLLFLIIHGKHENFGVHVVQYHKVLILE